MLHSREFGRILRAWMEVDLEAALAYVRQLPTSSSDYTQGILLVLETIGLHDPDRALALARELTYTREQLAIYSSLFARLAEQNLAASVQQLARVPAGAARENAVRALIDRWVRSDLPGALAWAQGLPDAPEKAVALEVALGEMAVKDPLQAIDLAQKSLTGPALERTVYDALQKLSATDPQGAAGLVSLLPPGEMQKLAAVNVARPFAAQNVQAALTWAKTLTDDTVRGLALNRILQTWAASDVSAASAYVAALPAGSDQHDAAVYLAGQLAAANPQNAITWAQALPDAATRPAALANAANTWAQRDPAAAARWVTEQSPATLANLGPETLNGALSYWVLQDAAAAQAFVQTLPSSNQASAAEYVAPLLAQNNPAEALAWAQALPSTEARDRASVAAYTRWLDNAPAAAQAWLQTANLAPQTKARLQAAKP
jgi:hypothetical protein